MSCLVHELLPTMLSIIKRQPKTDLTENSLENQQVKTQTLKTAIVPVFQSDGNKDCSLALPLCKPSNC